VAIIFHKWNCCQWLGRSRLLILSFNGYFGCCAMALLLLFLCPSCLPFCHRLLFFLSKDMGGWVLALRSLYCSPDTFRHISKSAPDTAKDAARSGGCEAQWKPRNLPSDEDLRHESRKNKRQIHEGHIKPSAPHYGTPTLRHPRRPMMDGQPAEPEPEPYPTSWPSPRSFM